MQTLSLAVLLLCAPLVPIGYAQELTITITETASVQADAAGHNLQMAKGYVLGWTQLHLGLLCDDARPTCAPLRSGQTYKWKEIHSADAGYAYGYITGGHVLRIYASDKGKPITVVYVVTPKGED